jgi:polyisoprenyl-teichoic acid--peptidoglycan teichoic acid transferase
VVLVLGTIVVLACTAGAVAAGYLGLRFSQIDRVEDIAIAEAAAGEPANYLLVGTDSREGIDEDDPDAGGFLGDGQRGCDCTDTIMVLRVDPEEKDAHILSFPRDLWLPIADGTTGRINGAHAKGEQVLIDTIEDNFGITINHYVEIDFVGFEQLVDAVGGIPMWFEAPVRDTHTGLSVPEAGCRELDGQQARRFVRSRFLQHRDEDGRWRSDPTADLGRITRQQIFIRRAISKAVSKGLTNPVTLNDLVSAGVENVRLDGNLSARDLIDLGRQFAGFDSDELIGFSIPSEGYRTPGGADVQRPLMRQAEPMLNVFRGLPPGTVTPQSVELTVLNGTATPGQAHDAAGALGAIGFTVVDVGDHDEAVGRTTVFFGDDGEESARTVARHVTGGAALVYDEDVDEGAAVLVTGTDFTTVHDQLAPEGSPDDLRTTTSTTSVPVDGEEGTTTTTEPETTTTTVIGYATGEPPPGVDCG